MSAVGLGSWITFNVGNDPIARDACAHDFVRRVIGEPAAIDTAFLDPPYNVRIFGTCECRGAAPGFAMGVR
jgi:hypothetical protein